MGLLAKLKQYCNAELNFLKSYLTPPNFTTLASNFTTLVPIEILQQSCQPPSYLPPKKPEMLASIGALDVDKFSMKS